MHAVSFLASNSILPFVISTSSFLRISPSSVTIHTRRSEPRSRFECFTAKSVQRVMRFGRVVALCVLSFFGASTAGAAAGYSVELDLQQQMAYLVRGRQLVVSSPISSGRYGHLTEIGSFKVVEKERNHFSSIYGKIVDARGATLVADADIDMKVPRGGKFIPAPMRYFMRFHGATGMHAGYLPGYAASHGCVRMPEEMAIAFFNAMEVGTPVHVFGRTPRTRQYEQYGPQPRGGPRYQRRYQPRFDPRFDQRFIEPDFDPQYVPSPDGW